MEAPRQVWDQWDSTVLTDFRLAANSCGDARSTVYTTQAGGWHDDTGVEWDGLGLPPNPGRDHPWDGSGSRGGAARRHRIYRMPSCVTIVTIFRMPSLTLFPLTSLKLRTGCSR